MSLNTIATMAHDGDLQQRFVACAAGKDLGGIDPQTWVLDNIWHLVGHGNLEADYQFAVDGMTVNVNPATGQRDDVINDAAIDAAVDARIAALAA